MSNQKDNSLCNEANFESFFKTHALSLRNYLVAKFSDFALAEDIVQEAYIKIWDSCDSVIPEKAKSYLFTIATNIGISKKRHSKVKLDHQNLIIKGNNNSSNQSPEFLIIEKEFEERLKKAIASLPEKQREVFLLNRIEKKKYREIAEMNEVSIKSVEKLMHKAIKKLKEQLGDLKF